MHPLPGGDTAEFAEFAFPMHPLPLPPLHGLVVASRVTTILRGATIAPCLLHSPVTRELLVHPVTLQVGAVAPCLMHTRTLPRDLFVHPS